MIQLTRLLCRQLRIVIKKALGRHKPDVRLIAGPDGLRVQAKGYQHAVEFHDPQPREACELLVPYAVLEDVQGNKAEAVRLYCPKKKVLAATWEERGVERTMQYTLPKDDGTAFHVAPEVFTENPPTVLATLHYASQTTDPTSSRYALGCIQLRGKQGTVAATDGRQLFLQRGIHFGFEDEVLMRGADVFDCAELPQDQPTEIGRTETHVVVRVGPWSLFCEVQKEGRFPQVEHVVPSYTSAKTNLDLHPADAQFFTENVTRLPGNVGEQGVTLELNGAVSVRAKTDDSQPAEIVLRNSTKSGEDVTVCLNRLNLVRAAKMGFENIHVFGNAAALLARDEMRSYVFMPLESQQAIKPSNACLRIESPWATPASRFRSSFTQNHMSTRRTTPTPAPASTQVAPPSAPAPVQATTPGGAVEPVRRRRRTCKSGGNILNQAIATREQLRTTLSGVKDLIRTLKAERRNQKSLKLALDSLKQLQSAA